MAGPQQPATGDSILPDVVPRVEAQVSHREFVDAVQPPVVMLPIDHARRIVKRGQTAESYYGPDVDVITTTTIPDSSLFCLPWEQELSIIQEFGSDYHIPTDASTYDSQSDADREEMVKQSLRGFLFMHDELTENPGAFTDGPPVLIPLVKGSSNREREMCYRVFSAYDVRLAAFYATQYFTTDANTRHYELVRELERICATKPADLRMFVIGTLGPKLLQKFPEHVVSCAGQYQWRKDISPSIQTTETMQDIFSELESRTASSLRAAE